MSTIPLHLDGYTDLPPGKIANIVTFLEMTAPPARIAAGPGGRTVRKVERPATAWYRALYRQIGEDWLWFSRAVMSDERLADILTAPATEILALTQSGRDIGLVEIDLSGPDTAEIVTFGVIPEATGSGAARGLMDQVLSSLFGRGMRRVWLHTCSFDHPAAVPFYLKCGFRAFRYGIEVTDDPRIGGFLPREAAPQVPIIEG